MENKKVLFISQEITPYLPESEMSTVSRYFPQYLQESGAKIRTFMPRYGVVNERRHQLHEVIRLSGMNLIISDMDHPLIIKVASIQTARMQVYFIDNEDYFSRKHLFKDDKGKDFKDNDERTIFFARGVIETVKKLRWAPDIIHCFGWFTSLVPLYIKKAFYDDPLFLNSKVIFSAYNDHFIHPLNSGFKEKLKIESINDGDLSVMKTNGFGDLTKLAIQYSDGVIISPNGIVPEMQKYIADAGVPFIMHREENYTQVYTKFYNRILNGVTDATSE